MSGSTPSFLKPLVCVGGLLAGSLALLPTFAVENVPQASATAGSPQGKLAGLSELTDKTWKDVEGNVWTFPKSETSPVVVVAFLGTECPLALQYAKTLNLLAERFANRGVQFVGVNANPQDSLAEIQAQARRQKLSYPILKDIHQDWLKALGAERTPQVVVLDQNRVIRYSGRIDDQHGIGKSRPAPTREDLALAVEQILAKKNVEISKTEVIGCLIGRLSSPKAQPQVTWAKDIAPILDQHCVECHRPGEIGPFSLVNYEETAGWAEMIAEVTSERRMPPWHAEESHGKFLNERRLSQKEIDTLKQWVAEGTPAGDVSQRPPLPVFTNGWQLPRQPDQVVWMSERPFSVKSTGEVKYQYFSADPGITEDRWISGVEVQPGNRAVVHHVIVFLSEDGKKFDHDKQFLVAYVPGLRLKPLPEGYAKRIPKGSKFIFQVHYTPNGEAQEDRTKVGLIFADPAKVTHEVKTESVAQLRFRLEPYKDNQRVDAKPTKAPVELELLSMSPHMHLRGKSFRYELQPPGGERQVVLNVPHYDFNWQTQYRLAEPIKVARGSTLYASATFDNSPDNLANPDPSQVVTWGDQSWEEMMIGYFDIAIPRSTAGSANLMTDWLDSKEGPRKLLKALDRNGSGEVDESEVQSGHRQFLKQIDADNSGGLSEEELRSNWTKVLKAISAKKS
ncbi:Redoxin domain protein [Planctopirus limnophila DSM 3776]|uniref:Redoxin domain protein n=1 Tax=Planctopirus limnophila (strain ATCC 43296 / DSM 3776 / IFAM 1008 / Mu 290) TaxID=521674 RepID=D5SWN9_PLAL2|nr:redoxin domain-containing protein [Planctopirus limnophila]ADG67389.1 Redoxin domain protein [Planctopirus limnophila DSM 3776]